MTSIGFMLIFIGIVLLIAALGQTAYNRSYVQCFEAVMPVVAI